MPISDTSYVLKNTKGAAQGIFQVFLVIGDSDAPWGCLTFHFFQCGLAYDMTYGACLWGGGRSVKYFLSQQWTGKNPAWSSRIISHTLWRWWEIQFLCVCVCGFGICSALQHYSQLGLLLMHACFIFTWSSLKRCQDSEIQEVVFYSLPIWVCSVLLMCLMFSADLHKMNKCPRVKTSPRVSLGCPSISKVRQTGMFSHTQQLSQITATHLTAVVGKQGSGLII